jgi:hypothetical protein
VYTTIMTPENPSGHSQGKSQGENNSEGRCENQGLYE